MAYCPEDGTELVCEADSYWICYSCPECGTHWEYNGDDPAYRPIAIGDICGSCGGSPFSDDPADDNNREPREVDHAPVSS